MESYNCIPVNQINISQLLNLFTSPPGTLSVKELGDATRSYFDDNVTELIKELDNMLPKAKSVERRRQILLCSQLDQYTEGAKVILELKSEFQLTGNFSDMDKILESVCDNIIHRFTQCSHTSY